MLLNSVSKLGLFRAFDDPVFLCVDIEAVKESLKKKRQVSSALSKEEHHIPAIIIIFSERPTYFYNITVIHWVQTI